MLETLGYDEWFDRQMDPASADVYDVARVVSVCKGGCFISKGDGEVFAKFAGSLFHKADSSLMLPTTGDWVLAEFYDDNTATVRSLVPRKTLLKRKTAGKKINYQLIAANIDVAFIVQAVDCNLSLRRIERYLVMVNESEITPVILLSKCDLVATDKIEEIRNKIRAIAPKTTVISFSNFNAENIHAIKDSLIAGQTYCLIGVSGVGKTTLMNNIIGREEFETQAVREGDSKGRHTTTSRELIQLENGSLLIDTPGMRELGQMSVDEGLNETFSDIIELADSCKFNDCSHSNEKGCAILSAIEKGLMSQKRYENFIKMKKESEFNEMSYLQKRNKNRAFGKMVKSVKKYKKPRY